MKLRQPPLSSPQKSHQRHELVAVRAVIFGKHAIEASGGKRTSDLSSRLSVPHKDGARCLHPRLAHAPMTNLLSLCLRMSRLLAVPES